MIQHEAKEFPNMFEAVSYRDGLLASGATGELEIKPHGDKWLVKVWQEGEEIIEPAPVKEGKPRKVRRMK